jgi:hypothetical protein
MRRTPKAVNLGEQRLRQLLEDEPNNIEALTDLAEILIREKINPGEANQLVRRALDLAPENPTPYRQMAQIEIALSHYQEAEENAMKALSLDPNIPLANFLLGQVRLGRLPDTQGTVEKERLYGEALEYYELEKKNNREFRVKHGDISYILAISHLYDLSRKENILAFRAGQIRVRQLVVFPLTILVDPLLYLCAICYVVTMFLLTGLIPDMWAILCAIPFAVGLYVASLISKNRRAFSICLVAIMLVEILFVAGATLFWNSYRDRLGGVVSENMVEQAAHELYDFGSIKESYNSPEAAILTWANSAHTEDVDGIWRSYSNDNPMCTRDKHHLSLDSCCA